MKNVDLSYFSGGIHHSQVTDIVYRKATDDGGFELGFLPEAEFIYHFAIAPDVHFQHLDIKEVYFEPYRTFLRLKLPTDISVHWPGSLDKLYVKATVSA